MVPLQAWVDRSVDIAAERGITGGSDFDRIVRCRQQAQELRRSDLDVLERAGWPIAALDATAAPNAVLGQAVDALGLAGAG